MHWVAPTEKEVNRYYDDPHKAVCAFDFALADPPFNVKSLNKERLKDAVDRDANGNARRFPLGLPRTDDERTRGSETAWS